MRGYNVVTSLGSSVHTIPFRVFRRTRSHTCENFKVVRPSTVARRKNHITDHVNDGRKSARERARERPEPLPPRCLEESQESARCSRPILDPGEAAPHTARRTHTCVRRCPGVVASCSVTSEYSSPCHYPTPERRVTGPDPTQQKQPRIARRTILMRGGGGGVRSDLEATHHSDEAFVDALELQERVWRAPDAARATPKLHAATVSEAPCHIFLWSRREQLYDGHGDVVVCSPLKRCHDEAHTRGRAAGAHTSVAKGGEAQGGQHGGAVRRGRTYRDALASRQPCSHRRTNEVLSARL